MLSGFEDEDVVVGKVFGKTGCEEAGGGAGADDDEFE